MTNKILKSLDPVALKSEIEATRKELFNLRLNMAAGQIKDTSQFKKLRTKIACALTVLNGKNK